MNRLPHLLGNLPERFQWSLHNIVGHPLSEILFQVGLRRWSDKVHDLTIPEHEPGGDCQGWALDVAGAQAADLGAAYGLGGGR